MNDRYVKWRAGLTLLLLILVLIITVQNAAMVDVRVFRWTLYVPRAFLIYTMLFVGFVVGWNARAIYRVIKG